MDSVGFGTDRQGSWFYGTWEPHHTLGVVSCVARTVCDLDSPGMEQSVEAETHYIPLR